MTQGARQETSRPWRILLAGILLATLARINLWTDKVCFWNDEAFSWAVATQPVPELLRMVAGDTHPPGHYLLLHFWIELLGDSIFSMRLLSGILSVAAVACVFWAGWYGFSARVKRAEELALVSFLLTAANPACASTAYMARMYAMLMFGTMLSVAGCLAVARTPHRLGPWLAWWAGSVIAVYSHNYGLFVVAGELLWLVGATLAAERPVRNLLLRRGVVSVALLALAYGPWVPVLVGQAQRVSGGFWIPPLSWHALAGPWAQLFSEPISAITWGSPPSGWLVVLAAAFGLLLIVPWFGAAFEWLFLAIALTHALGIVLGTVILKQSVFEARYLVHLVPLAMITLASKAFVLESTFWRGVALSLFMIAVSFSAIAALWHRVPAREAARLAALEVRKYSQPGDVFVGDAECFLRLKYYLTHPPVPLQLVVYAPELADRDRRLIVYAPALVREQHVSHLTDVKGERVWLACSHQNAWLVKELPGYGIAWATVYYDSGCADTRHIILTLQDRATAEGASDSTTATTVPQGGMRVQRQRCGCGAAASGPPDSGR